MAIVPRAAIGDLPSWADRARVGSQDMSTIAFTGVRIVPITSPAFDGTLIASDGLITALGPNIPVPAGAEIVDGQGKWLLPGFVDAHTHLGVHEEGEGWSGQDTNEMTNPNGAHVRAIDAMYPFDIGFTDALAGGVTCACITPGSGNPIGGLNVVVHTHGRRVDEMVLRHPAGLKSALGENPKRVYGDKKQAPSTRLGTAATIRQALVQTQNYLVKRDAARAEGRAFDGRDLTLEQLAMVLERQIPWRQHCHRSDDIATALRLADEFGYDLVIDHGTEAHLLADVLAQRGTPVLIGPLLTARSKVELRGRSLANPGKLAAAGVTICLITDHPVIPISFLVHQASLAVREGLDRQVALQAITINPARVLGVADRVGSLEVGKLADVVLWSGDPLDVMQRALRTYIAGQPVYVWADS